MNSVQTKEVPSALAALTKAKGSRGTTMAIAQQPVATIVEESITEMTATPTPAPEAIAPATPDVTPPSNERYSEKVYHDFRVHYDKTVYEKNTEINQLKEALAQATAPVVELPKTKEEIEEFRKTNPDVFDTMKAIALMAAEEMGSDVKNQLEAVKKTHAELKEQEAFAELLKAHPDAKKIRESAEFAAWFNEQPEAIKSTLANSGDVKSVIKLLTLYKVETTGVTPKETKAAAQKARIDDSLGVNIKGATEVTAQKKIWSRSEINAICSNYSTWNKYKDEIDLARREGRVDETK